MITQDTRQAGISQNTKHLTIAQIKRLIKNHGLTEALSNDKSNNIGSSLKRSAKAKEYCLEALNLALIERQTKAAAKVNYQKIMQAAALNAENTESIIIPTNYRSVNKPVDNVNNKNYAHIMQDNNKPKYKAQFNFSGPLWQLEQVCSFRLDADRNYTPNKKYKFNIAS